MYQRSTVHTASGRAAGGVSWLCTQSHDLSAPLWARGVDGGYSIGYLREGKKIAKTSVLAGDGERLQYHTPQLFCTIWESFPFPPGATTTIFDKNVRLYSFSVGNSAPLRLFPQSCGLNVPRSASRGKNAHIRGIKDGICRTPRILLFRAGDGDHLGTAESRSSWAVFEFLSAMSKATLMSK